jgi:glucose/mannose-6-phosphate isomerase
MKSEFSKKISDFPNDLGKYDFIENFCIDDIKKNDSADMYSLLSDYWVHIEAAIKQSIDSSEVAFEEKNADEILILGIGGSAMSGELLVSYLKYIVKVQCPRITLNRDWDISPNINITKKTWVFVCSYSGNTEETLSAFAQAQKYTDNIIAITSGGKLEKICNEKGYQVLKIPPKMMPRCAMFYSFFHLLFTMVRHNIIKDDDYVEFSHSIDVLHSDEFRKSLDYSVLDNQNLAIGIAKQLKDKIPVIYTTQSRLEAVNLRWRAQIQENSNQMCFGNFFPVPFGPRAKKPGRQGRIGLERGPGH